MHYDNLSVVGDILTWEALSSKGFPGSTQGTGRERWV